MNAKSKIKMCNEIISNKLVRRRRIVIANNRVNSLILSYCVV